MTRDDIIEVLAFPARDRPLRVHLIGVAGSGMSGLASLCLQLGHRVSGSDRVETSETKRLEGHGLAFATPHAAEQVEGVDAVIYSSAIKAGNAAYAAALARGIPLLRRAEALAAIMRGKQGIVVAGTHGKTTTSALLAHVLRTGGLDPAYYVGAEIPILGQNAQWSAEGSYFVAEGDESDGTLTFFQPAFSIVLNVEEEHLDYYQGIEEIKDVFATLVEQSSEGVIYCAEDANAAEVCRRHARKAFSYGWSRDCDYAAGVISSDAQSSQFSVFRSGELLGRIELNIPGRHNILNALSVIAMATELGVDLEPVRQALATFRGARRRFDRKYTSPNYVVVDDYGHHPTEVAATLETARSQDPTRLVVLFQPHRYSRTQRFATEFGKVFGLADCVFVTDIYAASEEPIPGVTGRTVMDAIATESPDVEAVFLSDNAEAHWQVGRRLRPGDLFLTLGAGDVHLVGQQLARDLEVLEALDEVMGKDHGPSRLYEPMSKHTTMRVGGPAQYWIEPHTFQAFAAALAYAKKNELPVRVVGRGSNLLVRDGGIPGVVIHPCKGDFSRIEVRGDRIEAGVGARFKAVAGAARNADLSGFEWMEGIPGNVGGGLRMNAGAMGAATFDQVVLVCYLDRESGEIREKSGDAFACAYRNVPELDGNPALAAVFQGKPASLEEIDRNMLLSKMKRRESQPVGASAGCIFKNPGPVPAGKLVDQLGFKNRRKGGARVSEVHGNFIVNDGDAEASDVLDLIDEIKAKALDENRITLEMEVKVIGEARPVPNRFVR